jgi:signal transduction histidine kinase/ligand-binding sensor domain-containing protein/ABC-type amino acid transport substrate-binding protein
MRINKSLFLICLLIPNLVAARSLESILQSGQLTAAFTQKAYDGIHRELAQAFADYLNVKLVPVIIPWKDIFTIAGHFPEEVITNPTIAYDPDLFEKCDIICNSITILHWRKKLMNFISAFKVTELLITPENKRLKHYSELKDKRITFLESTTFEAYIKDINNKIGGGIIFLPTRKTKDCYENVLNDKADGLILDSDNALLFMKNHKGFEISFPVGPAKDCGWGIKRNNTALQKELQNFFDGLIGTKEINTFFIKYFGVNYETYDKIVQTHSQQFQTDHQWKRDLDDIIKSQELRIGVRERPFVYLEGGKEQFNYALALAFAKELGVKPVLIKISTFSDYWKNDQGIIEKDAAYTPSEFKNFDIACDVIEPLKWRESKVDILSFFPLVQTIIALKETPIQYIDDLHDFQGVTSKSSTYEEILQHHGIHNYHYANVSDFIEEIVSKKADYAIIENGFFYTHNLPEIEIKLVIGKITERGWAIKKNHPKLKHKLYEFFEKASTNGLMDQLLVAQTGISFEEMKKFTRLFHWKYQVGKFSFVNYTKDDGLPQEPVLSIFQDRDGLMWFGTAGGLVRYNGRQMKVYDATDGLSGNVVFAIDQDQSGAMYLGMENGVSIIQGAQIKNIANGINVRKIVIDNQDNKWLMSEELFVYTKDRQLFCINEKHPLLNGILWDITLQKNGAGIFLGTTQGVYALDAQFQISQINKIPCHALSIGADGYLWMASKDKIVVDTYKEIITANSRLAIENTHIKQIKRLKDGALYMLSDSKIIEIISMSQDAIIFDTHVGILPSTLESFYQDNEYNYWIGFMGNIQKLTNVSLRSFYPKRFSGEINHLFQDQKKRMWISGAHGVYCYKDTVLDITPRLHVAERKCHVHPYGDEILIANVSGLFILNQELKVIRKNRFSPPIFNLIDIFVSEDKKIFLLTPHGTIFYLENPDSYPQPLKTKKHTFTLLSHENQIIGGNAEGLIRYDGNTFVQQARLNVQVRSIYSDADRLWLGTDKGFGLYENNQLIIPEHLRHLNVYAITRARQEKNLYLGTDKGFVCFNPETQAVEFSMDQRDGLPVNRVSSNALFVDAENLLWIGTYRGISIFDVTKRPLLKFKPRCHIENIFVNDKNIMPSFQMLKQSTPLILSWNQNDLIFKLAGLSFKDEQSICYDYYMRGLNHFYKIDNNQDSPVVTYQNLLPGQYDFHFRAKGKDNIWNAYQSFSFEIQKPFWQTLPFYISLIILLVGLTWICMIGYAKIRLRQAQKLAQTLKRKVKERTYQIEQANKELREINAAQNRFFTIISQDLRNPFSAVMGLADLLKSYYDMLDDNEKKGYIDEIHNTTDLLNKILDNLHKWSGIQNNKMGSEPSSFHLVDIIQEQLQVIEQTAQKKQIKIENQVDKDIKIFADANLLMILIEHLLSNAIKYSHPESCVKISAQEKQDITELSIIDEGVGISQKHLDKLFNMEHYHFTPGTANEKGTGLGLLICKVIVDRNDGRISIESEKGKGTTIVVRLPSDKK